MPLLSQHEFILVLSALVLILTYHGYLYQKVRRHPLQTAIGITNHARQTGALKNLVFRSYSRCRKKFITAIIISRRLVPRFIGG